METNLDTANSISTRDNGNPVPFGIDSALTGVVASIAMGEAALSNLINVEAKKIQQIACMDFASDEEKAEALLRANETVSKTVECVGKIEKMLAFKLHVSLVAYLARQK